MSLPPPPLPGVQLHSAPPDGYLSLLDDHVSVLVADRHVVVREGLKALVNAQPDLRVVGEAGDGPTALDLAGELNPDVVVMEVSLPGLDGAEVTTRLRQARPDRKVIVLTACEERAALRQLLEAGVRGYVLKQASAEQLVRAIRTVAAGGSYIDPEMTGDCSAQQTESATPELSAREVQVLRLIALGYSNKEIAAQLNVSTKTIETYKTRAMKKLKVRGRTDIVRHALRSGWLTDDAPEPLLVAEEGTS